MRISTIGGALPLLLAVGALVGCENVDIGDDDAISRSDVEAIEAGDGSGVVFSGTWVLDYTVTESTCGDIGLPDAFPERPPTKDETGEEEIVLGQSDGELTRLLDDIGDAYIFRGSVDRDGDFAYGIYYELAGVSKTELVSGKMSLGDNAEATLTATSTRRYRIEALRIACEATLRLTGTRTLAGAED